MPVCIHTVSLEHCQNKKKSCELFQTVYPNVSWFVNIPNLSLIDIKDISIEIISNRLNE